MTIHHKRLLKALDLARLGEGHTQSNPMVGAILYKNDRCIGTGYHKSFGGPHAEAEAFLNCKEETKGATLYITLEPCCSFAKKKTPPCVDLILEKGISQVYIGNLDPNPRVQGKSVKKLRDHGVEVEYNLIQKEESELNLIFHHYITHKTPYIVLKWAQTSDGFLAQEDGTSKWITNEKSRFMSHDIRGQFHWVAVGRNTAENDNPILNIRYDLDAKYPPSVPIIWGELSLNRHQFAKAKSGWIISDKETYCPAHFKQLKVSPKNIPAVLKILGEQGIASLMVEGGPKLIRSLWDYAQEYAAFVAPKKFEKGLAIFPDDPLKALQEVKKNPHSIMQLDGDTYYRSRKLNSK